MKNGEIRKGNNLVFDGEGYTTQDNPKLQGKKLGCWFGFHRWTWKAKQIGNTIYINNSGNIPNHAKCCYCEAPYKANK